MFNKANHHFAYKSQGLIDKKGLILRRSCEWHETLPSQFRAGFTQQPAVINGFSDLILDLYSPEAGQHAHSAVGMAELPFGLPVEIEAEIEINE